MSMNNMKTMTDPSAIHSTMGGAGIDDIFLFVCFLFVLLLILAVAGAIADYWPWGE